MHELIKFLRELEAKINYQTFTALKMAEKKKERKIRKNREPRRKIVYRGTTGRFRIIH